MKPYPVLQQPVHHVVGVRERQCVGRPRWRNLCHGTTSCGVAGRHFHRSANVCQARQLLFQLGRTEEFAGEIQPERLHTEVCGGDITLGGHKYDRVVVSCRVGMCLGEERGKNLAG